MGAPKRRPLVPDEFDEPVADEFDEPEMPGDTDDPDEPISNMQVGEPTAIIGGVEQDPADAGFVRQVANPERDRANEMAKTLASMGSNDAAGIYDQWAARGEPLASDRRYFSTNRSVGAGGRVAGSPLSAPTEPDTIGRTLRDAGVAGAQGAWQGFADNIVGGVENLKDTLGTERYGYPADLDKAQRVRDRVALAHQRSPKSSFAANAVGAAAPFIVAGVPTTPGGMIATGAGQGALSGYGHADPKTLEDAAWSVLGGASAGASATLPFAAAGPVGSYVGGKMVEAAPWVETQAGRANMRHALGNEFEAVAGERGGIQGIDDLAAWAHAENLDKGGPASAQTWRDRARGIVGETEGVQESTLGEGTSRGLTVNSRKIVNELENKAKSLEGEFPTESESLANKYRAEAKSIDEKTRVPSEYYDVDPSEKMYISTTSDRLSPEQLRAGQLEGVGGLSEQPSIGDKFYGDILMEIPRQYEAEAGGLTSAVSPVDYSGGITAGKAALADNMRIMSRVTGDKADHMMTRDLMRHASDVEGVDDLMHRYGMPKVEAVSSGDELASALVDHFRSRAKRLAKEQSIKSKEATIEARALEDPAQRRAALEKVADDKRRQLLTREQDELLIDKVAERRKEIADRVEAAAGQSVEGFRMERELVPNEVDTDIGSASFGRGPIPLPQRGTRIFSRGTGEPAESGSFFSEPTQRVAHINEPPQVPSSGMMEGYQVMPLGDSARETVENAPFPTYGPYTEMVPADTVPIARAHEEKINYNNRTYGSGQAAGEGMQKEVNQFAGRQFRQGLTDAFREQAPDLAPTWEANQQRMSNALTIANPAEARALRGEARPPIGLPEVVGSGGGWLGTAMTLARKMRPDATLGKIGYGTADTLRSVGSRLQNPSSPIAAGIGETAAEAAGARVGRGFAAPAYAEAKQSSDDARGHLSANAARKLLQTNPQALGPYAAKWQKALDANDPAAVSALMQSLERDNSYKRTVKRALEQLTAAGR